MNEEMKPKISDFGVARIFRKDEHEANTSRIVGTYGYVPPEYVHKGIYSTKSDVYSFGVLLLHIISGKKNACHYGLDENLNLLEHPSLLSPLLKPWSTDLGPWWSANVGHFKTQPVLILSTVLRAWDSGAVWSTDLGPWWSGADLGHDGAVISPDMNEEMGKEMEMGL
uniref:Protein kinase domain-containing protein n=1 Tax=Fagus sylvatica TaxID=28930 RepID=A0A2N9FWR6_FAGSY